MGQKTQKKGQKNSEAQMRTRKRHWKYIVEVSSDFPLLRFYVKSSLENVEGLLLQF